MALSLLRTLESALNEIWNIEKGRKLFIKIIYYWATISLGPIIVVAGTTLATQFTSIFTSSNYKSAYITNSDNLWVVGDKADILCCT